MIRIDDERGRCGVRRQFFSFHEYPEQDNFRVRPAHRITKQEYEKYKKFFKGVPEIEKW